MTAPPGPMPTTMPGGSRRRGPAPHSRAPTGMKGSSGPPSAASSVSDLRHIERRRLVELVDPVAEQQVGMAAPAVLGLATWVDLREVVVRRGYGLLGGEVS